MPEHVSRGATMTISNTGFMIQYSLNKISSIHVFDKSYDESTVIQLGGRRTGA